MKKFLCLLSLSLLPLCAQDSGPFRGEPRSPGGPGGPGGPRGPRGFGGFGGMRQEAKLVQKFDQDGNKRLDLKERNAAREFLRAERAAGRGQRGPGGRMMRGGGPAPAPGAKLSPSDVKTYGETPLYDPKALRTLFLEFESPDWEEELADFNNTDVEVPATLTAEGKVLKDVGVHFRGASSFFMVGEGRKRSLNLSLDYVHDGQSLGGYRTLNLLNSHRDPTFVRTALYYQIAREYIPAPKASLVRVVINGESWGIFVSAQQFNKDFVEENFGTTKGARWKVPGSPRGRGGLNYLGDDPAAYKQIYEIKTKDDAKSWNDLIQLCRVLNETPAEQLEEKLSPILDLDGVLNFLALENVLINSDGYWIRSSDYNIYQDPQGRFHIIPHDANETFGPPEGPGSRGGSAGLELSPLEGADDPMKPLLSKLLAVPALRDRYLGFVRHIAETWLDWKKLGPIAESYHTLVADDVRKDTRKLDSTEAFEMGLAGEPARGMSIKEFADQRRAYLLNLPDVKSAPLPPLTRRN